MGSQALESDAVQPLLAVSGLTVGAKLPLSGVSGKQKSTKQLFSGRGKLGNIKNQQRNRVYSMRGHRPSAVKEASNFDDMLTTEQFFGEVERWTVDLKPDDVKQYITWLQDYQLNLGDEPGDKEKKQAVDLVVQSLREHAARKAGEVSTNAMNTVLDALDILRQRLEAKAAESPPKLECTKKECLREEAVKTLKAVGK